MSGKPADPLLALRWRTGRLALLLPLSVFATILFADAALDEGRLAALADGRRGELFRMAMPLSWHDVNVPVALLALYLAFETFRFAWRWVDEYAVKATADALVPHPSLLRGPIPWPDVRDVRFTILPLARSRRPALVVDLVDGRRLIVRGIDEEGGRAERFAAAAARLASDARAGAGADGGGGARE